MTRKQMQDKINNLIEKCALYEEFIKMQHGQPAIDRLNLEFAIEHTNNFTEIRSIEDFEEALYSGKI